MITDQSAVFEFETYNVVLQTFISRLQRRFAPLAGVNEVMEGFKDTVHEVRQEMGQFNYSFFMSNLEAVMNDALDTEKQARQVVEVEEYFRDRLDRLRSEQLRVGKRLARLGARVTEISSTLPPVRPGGLPRNYTGRGPVPPGERPAAEENRIAVCSLSSRELLEPLSVLPGVALAGTLMTANLGIEELVRTLARRPAIRILVVCGRESPRFHAGQSLLALFRGGVDAGCRRIRGAAGYLPVLPTVSLADVERVRSRVEPVDALGECDPSVLRELVAKLSPRERPGAGPALPEQAAARTPEPAHGGGADSGGCGRAGDGPASAARWTASWSSASTTGPGASSCATTTTTSRPGTR
ncbi:hypothetical protein ACR6C2_30050 [Streptomyces sp. INA 01156]